MPLHRIRFEREEIDLRPGTTLIGRDESCTVTIHDPQVSRSHAMIFVDEKGAVLHDLASRNGTRINGEPVVAEVGLSDGDQVALAECAFVYRQIGDVQANDSGRRTTERRLRVVAPEAPFSGEARLQTPTREIDRRRWWAQLQLGLLEKAVATGRYEYADDIFQRIASTCDERTDRDDFYSSPQGDAVFECIATQLLGRGNGAWLRWVLDRLRSVDRMPTAPLVAVITGLPLSVLRDVSGPLDATVHHWSERSERLGSRDATLLSALLATATDVRLSVARGLSSSRSAETMRPNEIADTLEQADGPLTQRRSVTACNDGDAHAEPQAVVAQCKSGS